MADEVMRCSFVIFFLYTCSVIAFSGKGYSWKLPSTMNYGGWFDLYQICSRHWPDKTWDDLCRDNLQYHSDRYITSYRLGFEACWFCRWRLWLIQHKWNMKSGVILRRSGCFIGGSMERDSQWGAGSLSLSPQSSSTHNLILPCFIVLSASSL